MTLDFESLAEGLLSQADRFLGSSNYGECVAWIFSVREALTKQGFKRRKVRTLVPTLISVTNESSVATDAEVKAAVAAIGKQLARDVAPAWGLVPALEFVPKGGTARGCPCVVSDTPDVQGALGYHDEGSDGVPFVKVFVVDGFDWRTTLSHEILEVTGDAPASKWADAPDGSDYAYELADAVESDTYDVDGVPVSNFLYPGFFDRNAQPGEKLDHMGRLTKPFGMSSGGYEIRRTEPGQVSQTFANHLQLGSMVEAAPGLCLFFGADFPEAKKVEKIARAAKRARKR